jgi:hypothetical protein
MNYFTFGLWTGFVAGVVFTALLKQSQQEVTMEEKLLDLQSLQSGASMKDALPTTAPTSLAEALAQQDKGP